MTSELILRLPVDFSARALVGDTMLLDSLIAISLSKAAWGEREVEVTLVMGTRDDSVASNWGTGSILVSLIRDSFLRRSLIARLESFSTGILDTFGTWIWPFLDSGSGTFLVVVSTRVCEERVRDDENIADGSLLPPTASSLTCATFHASIEFSSSFWNSFILASSIPWPSIL